MVTMTMRRAPARPTKRVRITRSRSVVLSLALLVVIAAVLLLPLWLSDPSHGVVADRLHAPSGAHLFGTDEFGRDVLSRVVAAARVSWFVGVFTAVVSLVIGGVYGALAASSVHAVDQVMMRLLEVLLAFPGPLLALVLAVAVGPGLETVLIVLVIVYSAPVARLVRNLVSDELRLEYVEAVRVAGSSRVRILYRHVALNIAPQILVFMMTVAAEAILVEAGLSFLGAGISPPTPAWGSMVAEGQNYVFSGQWWLSLFPGAAIALTVLGCNTVADSFVDELRIGGRNA